MLKTKDELFRCFDKHEERRQARIWAIIKSLQFPDMQSRQQSIKKAFPDTYRWALDQDSAGLRTWLCAGSDVYWVSGKAGSGKSTFMKFLSNSRRTIDHLREWSGPQAHLIVIKCYFWYLGSALQKSIEGLLRTILCQILCNCPKVVETLLPIRWAHTVVDHNVVQEPWNLEELLTVLRDAGHAISHANAKTNVAKVSKFCIFIDGLDEYSGNHLGLIRMLESLVADGSTKICVSSRPWNVFVKNFEERKPHLCLQDLTGSDMTLYVDSSLRSSLSESAASDHITSDRIDIESIISEIVTRAEGVFLWVYLVVESVLRGLDECDSIATLKQRVLEYPPDLDGFFDTIVSRVDTVYKHQTAQALTLAYLYAENHEKAAECSSYLDFVLLEQDLSGLRKPQYLFDLAPQALSPQGFATLVRKTRSFLSARCKDLLVVPIPYGQEAIDACAEDPCTVKVQFLHRTVFEFLKTSGRQSQLSQRVPECFRDGSVFHILNMGKLKYYWPHRPSSMSDYFTRQAAFSLDHGWTGLDVRFIDQLHMCQRFHQEPLCVSIGQAYIAFRQFDTFWDKYTSFGYGQQRCSSSRCLRTMTHDVQSSPPKHLSLLEAALGVADCVGFQSEEIDLNVLALILKEISNAPLSDLSPSMAKQIMLKFLGRALHPLVSGSIEARTDAPTWTVFFGSFGVRHMYDVVQMLIHSGSDTMRKIMQGTCPVSEEDTYGIVWKFLTSRGAKGVTSTGGMHGSQPIDRTKQWNVNDQGQPPKQDWLWTQTAAMEEEVARERAVEQQRAAARSRAIARDREVAQEQTAAREQAAAKALETSPPMLAADGTTTNETEGRCPTGIGNRTSSSAVISDDELELRRHILHMQMLVEEAPKLAAPRSMTGRKRPAEELTEQLDRSSERDGIMAEIAHSEHLESRKRLKSAIESCNGWGCPRPQLADTREKLWGWATVFDYSTPARGGR